jgi:hypothetical protein
MLLWLAHFYKSPAYSSLLDLTLSPRPTYKTRHVRSAEAELSREAQDVLLAVRVFTALFSDNTWRLRSPFL